MVRQDYRAPMKHILNTGRKERHRCSRHEVMHRRHIRTDQPNGVGDGNGMRGHGSGPLGSVIPSEMRLQSTCRLHRVRKQTIKQ